MSNWWQWYGKWKNTFWSLFNIFWWVSGNQTCPFLPCQFCSCPEKEEGKENLGYRVSRHLYIYESELTPELKPTYFVVIASESPNTSSVNGISGHATQKTSLPFCFLLRLIFVCFEGKNDISEDFELFSISLRIFLSLSVWTFFGPQSLSPKNEQEHCIR